MDITFQNIVTKWAVHGAFLGVGHLITKTSIGFKNDKYQLSK